MVLILIPDIGNLLPGGWVVDFSGKEMPARWVCWMSLVQMTFGAWCYLLATQPRSPRTARFFGAATVWYCIQGIDELVAGNFFSSGLWEYPILLLYFAAFLFIKHEPDQTTPAAS